MGLKDKANDLADQAKHKAEELAGKGKEAAGQAKDDPELEEEGRKEQGAANLKETADKLKNKAKDTFR